MNVVYITTHVSMSVEEDFVLLEITNLNQVSSSLEN